MFSACARPAQVLLLLIALSAPGSAQPAPSLLIGGEEGAGAELGRVVDIAVLPQLIVVLEKVPPYLHVFDNAGRHIQAIGRLGGGPGEFRAPMSLTYDSVQRRLLVTDPANSRLTSYRASDTLAFAEALPTTVAALSDVCVLDNRLYALARTGAGLIRELELQGGVLRERRAFGSPRTAHALGEHPMLRSYVANGTLWCDSTSQTILLSSAMLGEVHMLNARTGTHRTFAVIDFVPLHIESTDGRGLRFSAPSSGRYEQLLRITADAEGPILNIVEVGPQDTHLRYRTVRLTVSGQQAVQSTHQWQQVGIRPNAVVCSRQDPYPTVALFRGSQCP